MADLDPVATEQVVPPDATMAAHLPTPGFRHAPPAVEYKPAAQILHPVDPSDAGLYPAVQTLHTLALVPAVAALGVV